MTLNDRNAAVGPASLCQQNIAIILCCVGYAIPDFSGHTVYIIFLCDESKPGSEYTAKTLKVW